VFSDYLRAQGKELAINFVQLISVIRRVNLILNGIDQDLPLEYLCGVIKQNLVVFDS